MTHTPDTLVKALLESDGRIFGHSFDDIKRGQQGGRLTGVLPKPGASAMAQSVMADVKRFGIPVSDETKTNLGLELPPEYVLDEETMTWNKAS